jgi:hypothetical protein
MAEPAQAESCEFSLHLVDPAIGKAELHRLLEGAVNEAAEAMSRDEEVEVNVKAEIRGAFGGIGEIVVALAVGFVSGAAKKFGEKSVEHFFAKYLEPRLKKNNLITRSFRSRKSRKDNQKSSET